MKCRLHILLAIIISKVYAEVLSVIFFKYIASLHVVMKTWSRGTQLFSLNDTMGARVRGGCKKLLKTAIYGLAAVMLAN